MTTLTSSPLAPLLDRLFAEAAANSPDRSTTLAQLDRQELDRLLRSKTEYRDFYTTLKDLPLPVSRETGLLLYMLARGAKARSIVEFGTSIGISTLHLAAALRDNGGGHMITTEFEPSKVARARANLEAGNLADLVEIREGDALQTLATNLPASIDLVLLDGAKALYPDILAILEGNLRPGAIIVADNANYCPEYLDYVRSGDNGYRSVGLSDDVEFSIRVG